MLTHPHPGQRVRLRYLESARAHCPHDRAGVVEVVGTGRPRNHGVRLDGGPLIVVPCGQLVPAADQWAPNPCGCGGCSVCGFYGLAPKAVVSPAPQEADAARTTNAPTLFDEVVA